MFETSQQHIVDHLKTGPKTITDLLEHLGYGITGKDNLIYQKVSKINKKSKEVFGKDLIVKVGDKYKLADDTDLSFLDSVRKINCNTCAYKGFFEQDKRFNTILHTNYIILGAVILCLGFALGFLLCYNYIDTSVYISECDL